MRFGKPEIRETFELLEDALPRQRINASLLHAGHEIPLQGLHALGAAFGPHRATQLIGARSGQTRGIRSDAHELLLKKGDAQRLAQCWFEERVQIGDFLAPGSTSQVGIH